MVNKEVAQFIISCAHWKFSISCYHESQQTLHTIESDTPFDMVFIYFFRSRGHPRLGWILQDPNIPVLYDIIWDRRGQWTEVNYIIPGHTMGFW